MLSKREKSLVVVAYYKGTADNDVLRGQPPKSAYDLSIECSDKILSELGLDIDFEDDFEKFMKELDVISGILSKEYEDEKKFTGTRRSAVHCLICKTDYIDYCIQHFHIPGSWEVKE
jgi:hypothetical protein